MDLDRLEEFIVIAEHKSIKKAAAALQLSPAALGARCRSFEQSLGTTLLERKSSGLELTAEGSLFYPDAVRIIEEYRQIRTELSAYGEIAFSTLCIANLGKGLPFFLGPFLDIINARYPYTQLNIVDDTVYSISEGLRSGSVDLYFAPALSQFNPPGIIKFLVSHTQPYILLPVGHRLSSKAAVSIKELDHERFILYPPTKETAIRDYQLANLKAADIHYTVYDHHSSTAFYELLVPIQKGIILSPTPFLREPPNTVALPVTDIPHEAASYLFYCPGSQKKEIHSFVSAFTKFIREEINHDHTKPL